MGASCPLNYNPADYYVQLLAVVPTQEDSCRQTIEMICDSFKTSDVGQKTTLEAAEAATNKGLFQSDMYSNGMSIRSSSPYKASWIRQFTTVFWRSWISVIKEPMLIRVRLLQTIVSKILYYIYCRSIYIVVNYIGNFGEIFS